MPFRIALSGLDAASTNLEVTGNNIANASTTGFKESRAEFADLYASTLLDVASTSVGQGVRVARIAQQFESGNVQFTTNNLDMALDGEGFFVLNNSSGSSIYTRAGAFGVDNAGYVVNHADQRLQVYPASTVSGVTTYATGATTDLQLPTASSNPSATSSVTAELNLNADQTQPTTAFSPTDASSYNYSTSTPVYDSLGTLHNTTMYYRKIDPAAAIPDDPLTPLVDESVPAIPDGAWDTYIYMDINGTNTLVPPVTASGTDPNAVRLEFNSVGAITTPSPADAIYDASGLVLLGGATVGDATNQLTFDYANTTQFGSVSGVDDLAQNGYARGLLSGLETGSTGAVFAHFTNGQTVALGKVALAKFSNAQGLQAIGNTSWEQTFASGDRQLGEAGTSSFGSIQSSALESSNVDIAEQLVNLITAQRNFQANAQVITTADTITQTIINLR